MYIYIQNNSFIVKTMLTMFLEVSILIATLLFLVLRTWFFLKSVIGFKYKTCKLKIDTHCF